MDKLKERLFEQGASLVGFAKVQGLYSKCDMISPTITDSENKQFEIPEYPMGISIAVAIPKEVIKGITIQPTMEYYNTYISLNKQLDTLAEFCEQYIQSLGYRAYAQTVNRTKEVGNFNTIMPHKTVAVNGGLGWIGKSALLVTPQYGSAVRLTSVLTDAPILPDSRKYDTKCKGCQICKNACPGGAITGNQWEATKSREWIFDAIACRKQARKMAAETLGKEITICGKCVEVCPYTQKYINSKSNRMAGGE